MSIHFITPKLSQIYMIQKAWYKKNVENKKKYSFVSAVIQDNKTQRGGKENEFFLSFFVAWW